MLLTGCVSNPANPVAKKTFLGIPIPFTKADVAPTWLEIMADQMAGWQYSAIICIVVGFIIAKLVQFLIKLFLKLIRFDTLCDKTRITKFFELAGIKNIPSNAVSNFFFWIRVLMFFALSFHPNMKILPVLKPMFFPGVLEYHCPQLIPSLLNSWSIDLLVVFVKMNVMTKFN